MKYIADLHIHSKFSRATSRNFDLAEMDKWAKIKGVNILAAPDFTHPVWFNELQNNLQETGEGLYQLKNSAAGVYFLLGTEISCIYSQGGKVRRLHLMVYAPNLAVAEKINQQLAKIGNLNADGRPILGLSGKKLAEIVFNTDKNCLVVPAHCWTPWFAVFGSKSGFNSLAECFEELTPYIYAVETGLSSDPKMNWQLSALDKVALISNSDAHSAENIGREANVFDLAEPSYGEIAKIIKEKDRKKFLFTIEFYPEEGKYHFDGHSVCRVRLSPEETKKQRGICPVCKKPLIIGVMNRVAELSDRVVDESLIKDKKFIPYRSLVSLKKIIAETKNVRSGSSKVVKRIYDDLIKRYQSEFNILLDMSDEELAGVEPIIAEGIKRVRAGRLLIEPGYDGVFGTVKIFSAAELTGSKRQAKLFFKT